MTEVPTILGLLTLVTLLALLAPKLRVPVPPSWFWEAWESAWYLGFHRKVQKKSF